MGPNRSLAAVTAALFLGVSVFALSRAASAQDQTKSFDIPAGSAAAAIREFAREADIQILVPDEDVRGKHTNAVHGKLSPRDALNAMLAGTGIAIVSDDGRAIVLEAEKKRLIREAALSAPAGAGDSIAGQAIGTSAAPEEIIVTAQKREERLKDVPVPVSVINTSALAETNQVLLKDFAATVPNFSAAPSLNGIQMLVLRGLATSDIDAPAVGIVVDDILFGNQFNGAEPPEIDPGDLERIEVLRGPQGTLYGASTIGGLIKYVTKDPSTKEFSGRVEVGTSGVYNGAQPGFEFRAATSIPLTNELAIRVSGFRRQDPGYIDNPILNLRGLNLGDDDGVRFSLLWKPLDNFSLKLSALYQHSKVDGASQVDALPSLGDLQQNRIANTGAESRNYYAYSAIINDSFWGIDFISLTGYNEDDFDNTFDYTPTLGAFAQKLFGVSGGPFRFHLPIHRVSQEVRLSAPLGDRFHVLAGGYYTHETNPFRLTGMASDPITGRVAGVLGEINSVGWYDEYAGFGSLTYDVTDEIDVQLGGRVSKWTRSAPDNRNTGIFAGVSAAFEATDTTFTYSATPRYKITPDLMIYARFANGFRPGTANGAVPVSQGAPATQAPDKTMNYEVGAKAELFDHRVYVDASIYYIDWSDIQLTLSTPQHFTYAANGGSAKSQGVELSTIITPSVGLTISGWFAYSDAVLTTAFPTNSTAAGAKGDRLPFNSRFSGRLAVDQEFPLSNGAVAFFGAAANFVGDRLGSFGATRERQNLPAYTKVDLKAGMEFESWKATVYVNNVADERGLVDGGRYYAGPSPAALIYITPRTVGVTLSKTF